MSADAAAIATAGATTAKCAISNDGIKSIKTAMAHHIAAKNIRERAADVTAKFEIFKKLINVNNSANEKLKLRASKM